jgi:hypothetical protein
MEPADWELASREPAVMEPARGEPVVREPVVMEETNGFRKPMVRGRQLLGWFTEQNALNNKKL